MRREADALAAVRPGSLDDDALRAAIRDTIADVAADRHAFRATGLATLLPTALYPLCRRWFGDEGSAIASRLLAGLGGTETADDGLDRWRLAARACEHDALAAAVTADGPFDALWRRLPDLDGGPAFAEAWTRFMARPLPRPATRGQARVCPPTPARGAGDDEGTHVAGAAGVAMASIRAEGL